MNFRDIELLSSYFDGQLGLPIQRLESASSSLICAAMDDCRSRNPTARLCAGSQLHVGAQNGGLCRPAPYSIQIAPR
jgi:hypothetical protein